MSPIKEITIFPPVRILVDTEHENQCSSECPMMVRVRGYILSCRLFGNITTMRTFDTGALGRMMTERIYRATGCINCLSKGEQSNES